MILLYVNEAGVVVSAHNHPDMLTKEQRDAGILFNGEIPAAEEKPGQAAVLHYDKLSNTLYYEYIERPLTQTEKMDKILIGQSSADERYKSLDVFVESLATVKDAKIAQLKELCTAAIYGGFTSSLGHAFGFNELDQANFTQQSVLVVLEGLADTDVVQWKAKSGVVELTVAEFKIVVKEAKEHKLAQQTRYWQLEGQVLAATSKANVDAINW